MPVVPRRSRNPKVTNSIITSQMNVGLFNLLTIAACREKPSSVPRACDACCANDPWACGQCAMCTATHHQTISRMVACYAGIAQLLLTAASRKVLARRLRDPAKFYVGGFHPIAAEKHRAHGVVVSHPLSMREALGSIPSVSIAGCRTSENPSSPSPNMTRRKFGGFGSGLLLVELLANSFER